MKAPRERWIEQAWGALTQGGPEAVRVESLARGMGVTKGSFYHHFANRRALLDALVEDWRARGTLGIIETVEQHDSAAARLRALGRAVFAETAADEVEAAVRAWAARDDVARAAVAAVDAERVAYVEGLLVAHGHERALARARADWLYRLVIGDFMWRVSGGHALSGDAIDALIELFMSENA